MAMHVHCGIGAHHAHFAAEAAAWACAFHPDLKVAFEGDMALLSSPIRSEAELRLIWIATLFNEAQLHVQAEDRCTMIEALLQ